MNTSQNFQQPPQQIPRPQQQQPPQYQQQPRQEMKGPQNSDINNILSGLKTREIPQETQIPQTQTSSTMDNFFSGQNSNIIDENDSIISISSLMEMQSNTKPKKNRRKRSERNTISLDI
jgi:hypothetical protein